MNKSLIKQIISATFVAALGLQANATDYTPNTTSWGLWVKGYLNGTGNLQESAWNIQGTDTRMDGQPTYEDSFYYSGTSSFSINIMGADLADNTLKMKSLTILCQPGKSITLDTLSGADSSWDLETWQPATLDIKESAVFSGDNLIVSVKPNWGGGINKIKVGENLDLSLITNFTQIAFSYLNNVNSATKYGEDNPSIVVGGQLKLGGNGIQFYQGNGDRRIPPSGESSLYVSPVLVLGGLESNGSSLVNKDPYIDSTSIYFKAEDGKVFTGGNFIGDLYDNYRNKPTPSTFYIEMNDTSGGGKQNIIITDAKTGGNNSNANIEVLVKNGKMGLGNTSTGNTFYKVEVEGGELSVEGVDHSMRTETLLLNGGKLIFTAYGNNDSDSITADSIEGSASQIFIDLSTDGFDYGDDLAGFSFEIFKGSTTDSNVSFAYNDILQSFAWEWDGGSVKILSGTVIPEPAAFAAMLGALALAAAWRRRK